MIELSIYNSCVKNTQDFTNKSGTIQWYMCGPTVHSHSHLGHARTYMSFDIIRKILERHYNYDVNLIMNITNVDDKIIKRSNEEGKDFLEVANYWENEFFADMKKLDIDLPDTIARVSEYIKEIVEFISEIQNNGFAYESNGSVYFNVPLFEKKMDYKPKFHNMSNTSTSNTVQEFLGDKKDPRDFVLWKKTKENEPEWDPKEYNKKLTWSNGRPGWHIECSAMSNTTIGHIIDIHSGGTDLKFPHHENEIMQNMAYNSKSDIKFFLHSGHVNIKGQKMSKSLKNFTTIKEELSKISANTMRLFFVSFKYRDPINIEKDSDYKETLSTEKTIKEFLMKVDSLPFDTESSKYETENDHTFIKILNNIRR